MKANELSYKDLIVGDWVVINNIPRQITFIDDCINYKIIAKGKHPDDSRVSYVGKLSEEVKPIPLTPEILEKNGFIRNIFNIYELSVDTDTFNNLISYQPNYGGIYICKETSEGDFLSEIQLKLQYVHELQNAMHLFKIEKEIVL